MDTRLPGLRAPRQFAVALPLLQRALFWCVPALVGWFCWLLAGPVVIDAARETRLDVLRGFYAPETGPLGAFRWSSREATITLPARPLPAVFELAAAVAPGGTRATLRFGQDAALELPLSETLAPRRFMLLWPARQDAFGLAQVSIIATPGERSVDARPLGVALSTVRLRPLVAAALPPPAVLGLLVLGSWLLGICLSAAGASPSTARLVAGGAGLVAALVWGMQPLVIQSLLLDVAASLGSAPVLRWLAALLVLGLAGVPVAAFLFRTLPLRGLLFARAAGLVLVGWLSWYGAAALRIPFGAASVVGAALVLAGLCCWGLRAQGLREVATLVRRSWRSLAAGELLFLGAFLFGLWLRWNGAVGPAIIGSEKPMDLALLQGTLRDPTFPPLDVWFSGHAVNYYYLGYMQIAAVAKLAGVSAGEAFNLGMATLFGLTALMVAGLVGTLCAMESRAEAIHGGHGEHAEEKQPFFPRVIGVLRGSPAGGIAAAALLGVALVLFAGNQIGALQVALGGSQVRVLDGQQLFEAMWQRASGAEAIRLSRPTPPAPDFGELAGWTPAVEREFDWWSPSRIVMDDIATAEGVERRAAITEFPFFSFFLGDLHAHVLALPHGLLILALALAVLARPTLPVYFATQRGWLELALTGALLASLYAVNAWDAPGAWLLFGGALALLYRKVSAALDRRSLFVHGAFVSLGIVAVMMTAVAPFVSAYRSPFGTAPGPQPWEGVPLLETFGRVVGPAPAHTGLHSFVAFFGLFLLPLLLLAAGSERAERGPDIAGQVQQMTSRLRLDAYGLPWLGPLLWVASALMLVIGFLIDFPLLALLPLALGLALGAWRTVEQPARALTLWGAAVAALLVFAADTVYVRDQLEGSMSRYITVFKLYFQAWVLWGTLAAYAVWALVKYEGRTLNAEGILEEYAEQDGAATPSRRSKVTTLKVQMFSVQRSAFSVLWLLLLVGALVYPVETLRRGEPWAPPAREVDGLAFLERATPDDAAGVAWLAANARVDDVVLTGWCECRPDEIGRVAAAAGVPTLLGRSEGHQRLWRAGWPPWLAEIGERERDIQQIYTAAGAGETRDRLTRYGVDYVYVGGTERALYPDEGLERLGALLEPVFAQGDVRIYRVPQQ